MSSAEPRTTIGVIQARMGSLRLPGKILAPLAGGPLLARLWARIERARGIDEWWLATSSHPSDDVTEAWGFELGLRVFRGDERDVLSRFVAIAEETRAEWLVRVTADNPFLDACVIEALLEALDAKDDALADADLIRHAGGLPLAAGASAGTAQKAEAAVSESANLPVEAPARTSPRLPMGYGVELARSAALQGAAASIPEDAFHHRIHVTSWLATRGRVVEKPTPGDWPERGDWRWTVDTYEDLAMARSAFRLFGSEATRIDYPAMVARLDAHPEIPAMNRHIVQKSLEEG